MQSWHTGARLSIAAVTFIGLATARTAAQSLIPNGSFESGALGSCASGSQGVVPAPWAPATPVQPGADTYTCNCSANPPASWGIPVPDVFGNFPTACPAPDGVRFLAAWSHTAAPEAVSTTLLSPLTDGGLYRVSAWLRRSMPHGDSFGFDVYLSADSQLDVADALLASFGSGASPDSWSQFSVDAVAPIGAQSLPYIVFAAAGGPATDSYVAIDDIVLVPLMATYCTAKLTSNGCVPSSLVNGVASASSPSPFHVGAVQVINNKSGLLFFGVAPASAPFQGGTKCVAAPTRRTPIQSSGGNPPPNDCSGSFSFEFNSLIQSGTDPWLVPGQTVFAQHWFRDPADPFTTGLSDAVRFLIQG